jgi:catechol 2,3-dioxygenase-like lactoylglutathione lyase family enzyme
LDYENFDSQYTGQIALSHKTYPAKRNQEAAMKPIIDHIQITVKDLKAAEPFYDKFLPILGFDINRKSSGTVPEHEFDVVEYFHPLLIFAINSPREAFREDTIHRRKPGALHHLAFKAESCAEVDRLYLEIKKIGANIVDGPRFFPQHGENYYALYFKDLEGIKYEIVYEDREKT